MARHQEEKKKEEEAKAIALEAEKAAKEAPEMAAAESQRNAAEALTASQGAVSTESGSGRLNKAPEGNVLKGAESALKMEESRLQIYKEVVGKGFASEMDSNRLWQHVLGFHMPISECSHNTVASATSANAAAMRNYTIFQGAESKNGHLKKLENAKERLHLSRHFCWTLKDFVSPLLVALEFFMLPPLVLIASLTLIKDSERLVLLKEIGGIRVHEERHRESLKIMQETEYKEITSF
ncbi:hypothetical protein HanPI659440_Chr13g0513981 [Helianthus annuus]|nr:hypothetical protein HanPI659440_Chr13g0513981 [Helianthus annuus]